MTTRLTRWLLPARDLVSTMARPSPAVEAADLQELCTGAIGNAPTVSRHP